MSDTLFNILVFVPPAVICIFIARHYWRTRPSALLKGKTTEEQTAIKDQAKGEQRRKSVEGARLFGFILLLGSIGISIGGKDTFGDIPLWVKAVLFLFGIAFIYAASREAKRGVKGSRR